MLDAFGSYVDVDGSGKVHLVYYDIIDGGSEEAILAAILARRYVL